MTDEPQVEQLENRIDTLESKIEKMMPSRRDALKMGGAALVGGAAMSGTASAGTNQVGTIGDKDATPPQLVDLHSEDINNADTVTTQDLDAISVNTEQIGSDRHYAEAYDGADATDRLNNAISDANAGEVIYLESANYDSITVSKRLKIVGTGGYGGGEPSLLKGNETWTFDERVYLSHFNSAAFSEIILNVDLSALSGCQFSTACDITINADGCRVVDSNAGDVTFSSGASGGLVDACTGTAFTDNNGGNTRGDIA